MTITYETLFEILRREKNQDDLQKLDPKFFDELDEYVEEKNNSLNEKPRLDQFMEGYENEQNAIKIQLTNIRKIIRDIFDRRERKIMEMAINKAKTGSNIIDTSALLPQEKDFFNAQIKLISEFRYDVLEPVLTSQKPGSRALEDKLEQKDLNMAVKEENTELKKVKVTEAIPKFVGVDLEIYGPFSQHEEIELHPEIAEMLIKTNRAKVI
ncbi:DNA replication complex GINS family protein [Candidatus Woesearchaeota archaeon]|nr:hypothetical protein [uncultured archaeon]MBS3115091.1 DNA replication complex GINS family protein [Candidatus Woesearchaeota archaeon]